MEYNHPAFYFVCFVVVIVAIGLLAHVPRYRIKRQFANEFLSESCKKAIGFVIGWYEYIPKPLAVWGNQERMLWHMRLLCEELRAISECFSTFKLQGPYDKYAVRVMEYRVQLFGGPITFEATLTSDEIDKLLETLGSLRSVCVEVLPKMPNKGSMDETDKIISAIDKFADLSAAYVECYEARFVSARPN